MNILLKKVTIIDSLSTHHNTSKDIFIKDGIITSIGNNLEVDAAIVFDTKGTTVSPGWVDVFAHFTDPGFEHRDTLETGAAAAVAGGYTQVFVLPNTQPVVSGKAQVEYIVQKCKQLPVTLQPLGAITKNIEGKELAEMYDMQASGAVAFSDGLLPVQSAALLLKALQYIKAFDGVLLQVPVDKSLSAHGLMHEGIASTQLGLPGIPAIAEELMIARDIELLKYTDSKLHITGVSTAKGIEIIKQAKADGLQITCSVTPYHLVFCDEDVRGYDTNLKVNPPLRSANDREALRNAVVEGVVDCIASHHIPQHWDDKTCEFEYAKNGMLGLQTSFAAVNTAIPRLPAEKIVALFSGNARNIFALQKATIEEGNIAEISLFTLSETSTLTKENNKSKSGNSPFIDVVLNGKVAGILNKGSLLLNK